MAAHVSRMRRRFGLGPADRVLQFAALAFDASIDQIFPALSCGAALVLPEHGLVAPATLLPLLARHGVTLANLPPAYFGELVAELTERDGEVPRDLRLMVLGGDRVRPGDVDRFASRCPDVAVLNAYGPTETTVTTTVADLPLGLTGAPPIGRAVGTGRCTCWTVRWPRCRWVRWASCSSVARSWRGLSGPAGCDGGAVRAGPVRW
ncbi:AMP-binding protein [Micromonospora sp. BRA006-A]|nr:AMP-binding protein [Micromonospora sp. BRA006-A]